MISTAATQVLLYATLLVFFAIGCSAGVHAFGRGMSLDTFLTARGSQGWVSLGLNLFAAGLGVWTIFTLPQVGYDLGITGAFAYSIACILPFPMLVLMGKVLRARAPDGVTITGFVLARFGWAAQVLTNLTSLGYMFVYLISELTALSLFISYYNIDSLPPLIAVCAATAIYTAIGGMPASLLTDRFQGWFVIALVLLATIAFATQINIDRDVIQSSGLLTATTAGWESFVTLGIAVSAANVFHQGYWQRVYAAQSQRVLILASVFAAALTFPFMFVVSATGFVDVWRNVDNTSDVNAFFDITATLPDWCNGVVLVLTIALICSSVDTLQSAISALVVNDIFQQKIHLNWARGITAILNVPALIIALKGYNVLTLFLCADLIAASIVLPVVSGLIPGLDGLFNGLDFCLGTIAGVLSVGFFGWARYGDALDGFNLLIGTDPIFNADNSIGAFVLAPGTSAVVMLLSAGARRLVYSILRSCGVTSVNAPDFVPAKPRLFDGPGNHGAAEKDADGDAGEVAPHENGEHHALDDVEKSGFLVSPIPAFGGMNDNVTPAAQFVHDGVEVDGEKTK